MVTPTGLVVLTDRRLAAGPLLAVVEAAVRGGAGWVILRERDLPYAARRALADELRSILPPGRLIVAGPDPLGGDAVHLAEADPVPAPGLALVGRSRHGMLRSSEEDYVTMSPVFATATKPGYGPALGPAEAARRAGAVPWLALGGIDSAVRAGACAAAGAAGIAVLGAVMRSSDPARSAAELSAAFAQAASGRPPGDAASDHAAAARGCGEPTEIVGAGRFPGPTQSGVGEEAAAWGQRSKTVAPGCFARPTRSGVGEAAAGGLWR